jgi:hypothetical protein
MDLGFVTWLSLLIPEVKLQDPKICALFLAMHFITRHKKKEEKI